MAVDEGLPDYAPMLSAFHSAFRDELRAMISALPIAEGDRVLEVACGDGVYSSWIAERVGATGKVVAVDVSPTYLETARRGSRAVEFLVADLARLPIVADTFDVVWCAQSLYSLPDPVEALRRMRRVVRPGGVVAVLEDDTLHQVLLPWPVEVELAVRAAELRGFVEESDKPRKFYVGRRLPRLFRAAGLVDCRKRTWASDRQAPLGAFERAFLGEYLRDLRERARPHLDPDRLDRFESLVDPESDEYLLDDPDLAVTCIDHVVWGFKPGT